MRVHPYRHFVLALLVLCLTALITALAALDTQGSDLQAARPEIDDRRRSLSPRGMTDEIEKIVRAYLEAPSVEARLPFVRRPQTVLPLMKDHARRYAWKPVRVADVHLVATLDATQREQPLILASAETEERQLIPLVLEQTHETYRVDWESHVGYSPMDLNDFLGTPAGTVSWFRAHASKSDYHNYHFDENSDTVCLRLTVPHTEAPFYAYLKRTHPQFAEIASLLAGKQSIPLILALRQESPLSGNRRQVEVAGLVQARWMVEEERHLYAESVAARAYLPAAR